MRCQGEVWDNASYLPRQCEKNATSMVGGKHYCKIHNPYEIELRRKKRTAGYEKRKKDKEIAVECAINREVRNHKIFVRMTNLLESLVESPGISQEHKEEATHLLSIAKNL